MGVRHLLLPLCLAIAACDQPPASSGDAGRARQAPAEGERMPAEVPEGAIRIRDDYYMVPLAEKVGGCQAYRAFSTTSLVPQVIYYRTADGRFVMDRNEAACE